MKLIVALCSLVIAGSVPAGGFEWKWSRELPKQVATGVPGKNRTIKKVDELFAADRTPNGATDFGAPRTA
jgi:hypothetical protein